MIDLRNRIKKNYDHLKKWAKRTNSNCFRVYDRDIKEYPLTIDFYNGRILIYLFSFPGDDENKFLKFEKGLPPIIFELFGESEIFWKHRFKRKKLEQYEKLDNSNNFFNVLEYGVSFKVNLEDYIDTGLFLDHRETRQRMAKLAEGKKLLNLFSYTCSFSVHAARNNAITTSVDLSNTYINWGQENFLLNNISLKKHQFIREDCLKFLANCEERFDVIVIDPPTISRSKKMEEIFDVQKDHSLLINKALKLLEPQGTLFFSTNLKDFKMETADLKEITSKTLPKEFNRSHRSFQMVRT